MLTALYTSLDSFFLYEGMLEFPRHWSFALVAVERNFWACLFSGAAQGPDAQVWQSWLHHAQRQEGQTAHWCSLCFSSGP